MLVVINKYSLMRDGLCDKLPGRPSQLFARPAVIDSIARYWPRIATFSTPPALGGSRQNIATTFGTEKIEWCGYLPDGEKIKDMFIRFDKMYERDRQTDRQTPHDGIGCASV